MPNTARCNAERSSASAAKEAEGDALPLRRTPRDELAYMIDLIDELKG